MAEPTLAARFETHRAHLKAVAHRLLGSPAEADDAVQEAWLRLSRAETDEVENLRGWLTTVVARICLDVLRSRRSRREEALVEDAQDSIADVQRPAQPDSELWLADSVGLALLVVLETLAPAERVAFVLHDMFDLSFEEIAAIVGRTPVATRQLASRARRRVQGAPSDTEADLSRQRTVVDAFLSASREGDFQALLAVLDPNVVLRPDQAALSASAARPGAPKLEPEIHGAAAVAGAFAGRAKAAQPAIIEGSVGAVWAPGGQARAAFALTIVGGKIIAIDVIADPQTLASLDLTILDSK